MAQQLNFRRIISKTSKQRAGNKVLLVEPKSRNAYPPLGLMKIATYHKLKGDKVSYAFGNDEWYRDDFWDVIYITSLFTYNFESLIETIRFYSANLYNFRRMRVGGIAATLMADEVEKLTGIRPHIGTLSAGDKFLEHYAREHEWASYLAGVDYLPSIDILPPDYGIFSRVKRYGKLLSDAYILYSTKGCPNRCSFCAVHQLEPDFIPYIPIRPRIEYMAKNFGERCGLLFLDNNVAASDHFFKIIDEIKDLGFQAGSKFGPTRKQRYVDFNQGVDARRMDSKKMSKIAEIAIKPLRLAFDHINMSNLYVKRMTEAIDVGIRELSTYLLYNFVDEPRELYQRMRVNIELNEKYDSKIFSFPMKYIPLNGKDRSFVGQHWTKRQLRAVQIILNVTRGIVSHRKDFFEHAFGHDEDEFQRILLMPQPYIFYREEHERNGCIDEWHKAYSALSMSQKEEFAALIAEGRISTIPLTSSGRINNLLTHYECEKTKLEAQKELGEYPMLSGALA